MPGEPAVVVSVGMVTAVGLTARETAASARAGTMRFAETAYHDRRFRPFTLAVVPEDGLPAPPDEPAGGAGFTAREWRMLRLALPALTECARALPASARPVALCLALPEHETARPLDRQALLHALASEAGGIVDPQASDPAHAGRAGGLVALGQAVATIQSGRADFALAGGVDTFRDAYVLGTLDRDGRVKSEDNLDGFIPGEGAAFLLLASASAAARHALRPIAEISPVAVGFEPGHLYSEEPYRGDGLAATFAQLISSGAVGQPIRDVYASMNGESHWAKEWGVGYLRNRAAFQPDHGMHHPADSFGDTGAACGPIMAALATLGVAGAYRRAPVLVYGSSDAGLRAAIVVNAPRH